LIAFVFEWSRAQLLNIFSSTYIVSMIKITVNSAYQEIIKIGKLIQSSRLNWTLVRVGFLNNNQLQPLKVGYYGRGVVHVKISSSSIAKFMLDQVVTNEYVTKPPAISN
jgi:hypothetical protein